MENFNYDSSSAPNEAGPKQLRLEKAHLDSRIVAYFIDHFIIAQVYVVLTLIVIAGGLSVVLLFIAFPLLPCMKDIVNGQSPGKYLLGMVVRDSANQSEKPSASRLFLRNIFVFMLPIEFLILIFSQTRTKLGDSLAGTDVYYLRRGTPLPSKDRLAGAGTYYVRSRGTPLLSKDRLAGADAYMAPARPIRSKAIKIVVTVVLIFVLFAVFIALLAETATRNTPAFRAAIYYIETHQEVRDIVGDITRHRLVSGTHVSGAGRGFADYNILVIGSQGRTRVHIQLERVSGREWKTIDFSIGG